MQNLPIATPSVTLIDGQAVTTSRAVANYFHKQHKDVIRKVESIECSQEFRSAHFCAHPYKHVQNGEIYTEYQITRDGFTFLAMGFTGKKAAAFKEAYIAEFNRLEASATEATPSPSLAVAQGLIAAQGIIEEQTKRLEVASKTINEQEEAIDHLENFLEGGMTIPAFGRMLNGVNSSQLVNYCRDELEWVYDSSGHRTFRAYHKARGKYLREVPVYVKNLFHLKEDVMSIVLLDKGARRLYKLYREGKLPMKKDWNGQFTHANFNMEEAA